MSKYAVVSTEYADFKSLVAALEKMYGRGKIEVGNLIAFGYGRQQKPADIVIRRDVCGGFGDLAFKKMPNGKYQMIKDDMMRFNHARLTRLYIEQFVRLRTHGKFRILNSDDQKIELQVIE